MQLYLLLCCRPTGGCCLSRADAGGLGAAGSGRSPGAGEEFSGGEARSHIQRALRPSGPTPVLHLHPAQGGK